MKTKKEYRSANDIVLKDNMEVSFDLKDSLEHVSASTTSYMGRIDGEPFSFKKTGVVSILCDEGEDEFCVTVPVDKVTVPLDMECEDCKEEFNHGELKTVMVPDEVGKGLSELFGCPKCGSQNYIRNEL